MHKAPFDAKISEHVWRTKYRWFEDGHTAEPSIEATWDRVALAVSGAEAHHHNEWRERFRAILSDFRFLPGGRILAGAGTSRRDTLFNCFVMVTRTAGIIASAFCSGCRCQRRRSVAHDGNGAVLCGQCNFQDGAATAKRKRTGDWTRLATSLGVWA